MCSCRIVDSMLVWLCNNNDDDLLMNESKKSMLVGKSMGAPSKESVIS